MASELRTVIISRASGIVESMRTIQTKTSPSFWLLLAVGAVWLFFAFCRVDTYFFIFDDYKLFGQTATMSWIELVSRPHFFYFRPLVHLGASLQFGLFGWSHPGAYLVINHALYIGCMLLFWRLLGRGGASLAMRHLALVYLLMAPFYLEALSWASCQFDLLAAFFTLLGLNLWGRAGALTLYGTVLASMLCKEVAVVAWCLGAWILPQIGSQLNASPSVGRGSRRGLLILISAYLVTRGVVMWLFAGADPLAGHRGSLFAALIQPQSAWYFGQHILGVFIPGLQGGGALNGVLTVVFGSLTLGYFAMGMSGSRGQRGWLLIAALVLVVPSAWIERSAFSTAGGRLMVLSLFPLAVIWAHGVEAGMRRLGRKSGSALLAIWLGIAGLGLASQTQLWSAAYGGAESSMARFEAQIGQGGRLFVEDMPYVMQEGPYMLKPYAFSYYKQRQRGVPIEVKAKPRIFHLVEGRAEPVMGWSTATPRAPEGYRQVRVSADR